MKMKFNEFLAIVYASLFDYYLDIAGAKLWAVGKESKLVTRPKFTERMRRARMVRRKITFTKRRLLEKALLFIKKVPTVEAVFLTGSVAVWNARPGADIDLLVVTLPNTLWLTRAAVVGLLKVTGQYRSTESVADRICTNIFLDTRNLKVSEKNLYTAHEVLQAECLFDRQAVEWRWIQENIWAADFLPNVFLKRERTLAKSVIVYKSLWEKFSWLFAPVELLAFLVQAIYMKSRITREKIGWGIAVFHPNDLTTKVFQKWQKKLSHFGYNEVRAKTLFFRPC